jgi:hypothetical protein
MATGYGLDDQGSEFECRWVQEFSLLHVAQTGSGAHTASYQIATGGSFPGGKADHSRPTSQENVGIYLHSPIRLHNIVFT